MSSEAIALIIASSIGAFGTVVVGTIKLIISFSQMAKKNTDDHGAVQIKLAHITEGIHDIKTDVKSIDTRIDTHIQWHLDVPSKESIS